MMTMVGKHQKKAIFLILNGTVVVLVLVTSGFSLLISTKVVLYVWNVPRFTWNLDDSQMTLVLDDWLIKGQHLPKGQARCRCFPEGFRDANRLLKQRTF